MASIVDEASWDRIDLSVNLSEIIVIRVTSPTACESRSPRSAGDRGVADSDDMPAQSTPRAVTLWAAGPAARRVTGVEHNRS